jgi:hypothetical protein
MDSLLGALGADRDHRRARRARRSRARRPAPARAGDQRPPRGHALGRRPHRVARRDAAVRGTRPHGRRHGRRTAARPGPTRRRDVEAGGMARRPPERTRSSVGSGDGPPGQHRPTPVHADRAGRGREPLGGRSAPVAARPRRDAEAREPQASASPRPPPLR